MELPVGRVEGLVVARRRELLQFGKAAAQLLFQGQRAAPRGQRRTANASNVERSRQSSCKRSGSVMQRLQSGRRGSGTAE